MVNLTTSPNAGVLVTNVQINGPDASSFSIQGNGCQTYTLGGNNSCQIYIPRVSQFIGRRLPMRVGPALFLRVWGRGPDLGEIGWR
jgi:hypothetical protein